MSRRARKGLTLIEVAVVVCFVGVFSAVFIPTFVSRLRTSKTSEAAEQLQGLHQAAASYFATPHRVKGKGGLRTQCLPLGAGPTPGRPSPEPREVDFSDSHSLGRAAWSALGFQPDRPLRYRYTFVPLQSGCGLEAKSPDQPEQQQQPLVFLRAEGDLDNDQRLSLFERGATVRDGELVSHGPLLVTERVE